MNRVLVAIPSKGRYFTRIRHVAVAAVISRTGEQANAIARRLCNIASRPTAPEAA